VFLKIALAAEIHRAEVTLPSMWWRPTYFPTWGPCTGHYPGRHLQCGRFTVRYGTFVFMYDAKLDILIFSLLALNPLYYNITFVSLHGNFADPNQSQHF